MANNENFLYITAMKRTIINTNINNERVTIIIEVKTIIYNNNNPIHSEKTVDTTKNNNVVIRSPITGKILSLHISEKDTVFKGKILAIIESMKTYIPIVSPISGIILKIKTKEGECVKKGEEILIMRPT